MLFACRKCDSRPFQGATAKPAVGTVMTPAATYGKLLERAEQAICRCRRGHADDKFNFAPPEAQEISKVCAPLANR